MCIRDRARAPLTALPRSPSWILGGPTFKERGRKRGGGRRTGMERRSKREKIRERRKGKGKGRKTRPPNEIYGYATGS